MLGLNPNWNPTIKKRFDSKPYLPWSRFSICVSFFVVILPPFNLPVRDVSSTSKDCHFNFAESKIGGNCFSIPWEESGADHFKVKAKGYVEYREFLNSGVSVYAVTHGFTTN